MKRFLYAHKRVTVSIAFLTVMLFLYFNSKIISSIAEHLNSSAQVQAANEGYATIENNVPQVTDIPDNSTHIIVNNVNIFNYNEHCSCNICTLIRSGGTPDASMPIPQDHIEPEDAPEINVEEAIKNGLKGLNGIRGIEGVSGVNIDENTTIQINK